MDSKAQCVCGARLVGSGHIDERCKYYQKVTK
jgi:hypothetical protein